MRVGVTLAVVGAIVAEWAGAERGLGVLVNLARGSMFDIPLMYATILTIALVGIALYLVVIAIEHDHRHHWSAQPWRFTRVSVHTGRPRRPDPRRDRRRRPAPRATASPKP